MGAADEVEVVGLEELCEHVLAEDVADAALLVLVPALLLEDGVGPEQVAEQPGVGDVGGADDAVDLVDGGQFGREAAVHAEDAVLDDGGHGHAVEAVDEALPELDVVAALACIGQCLHSS